MGGGKLLVDFVNILFKYRYEAQSWIREEKLYQKNFMGKPYNKYSIVKARYR